MYFPVLDDVAAPGGNVFSHQTGEWVGSRRSTGVCVCVYMMVCTLCTFFFFFTELLPAPYELTNTLTSKWDVAQTPQSGKEHLTPPPAV